MTVFTDEQISARADRLSLKEKVGYGVGDMASSLVFSTINMFLMFYYTDIYGLSAALVGTLFLVTRLWDAVSDPLMGAIADRTRSPFGKFRPYLLWVSAPLGIAAVLTFTTPDVSDTAKVVWAFATYALLMTCYTAINIPYSSLPAMMTGNNRIRTELASYRMFFYFSGALIVALLTLPLIELLGQGNPRQGYQYTMILLAGLAVALFATTFVTTRERVAPIVQPHDLKADLKVVSRNPAFWVLLLIGVLLFSLTFMPFTVGLYYFSYVVGDQSLASGYFAAGNLGMISGALVSMQFTRRFCKKRVMIMAQLAAALLSSFFYVVDPDTTWQVYGLFFAIQSCTAVSVPIIWSMVADTADYAEWTQKRRVIGITTSSITFSHKFGMGIGGAMSGALLSYFGYVPGMEQTDTALQGIILQMSLLPAAGYALVAFVTRFYPIDARVCERMQNALTLQRATAA